jgi:hypothetical protein
VHFYKQLSVLTGNNATHSLGIETKNSFNGAWGNRRYLDRIFYKDIKAREDVHRKIRGRKTIKFHDNPVPEKSEATCAGIDCWASLAI